jgi:parallel beta-helix repeat protein
MYHHMLRSAFVLFVTMAAGSAASGATRNVSTRGADTGNCSAAPCRTIHYAVAQSANGDRINVASGTYTETVTVDRQLTLIGNPNLHDNGDGHGDNGGGNATLDAAGHDNGFVITGAAASGSVLRGFTVKNAGREGIFALKASNLTITGNTLINNDLYGPNSPQCPAADPDDCGEALHLQSVTNSTVSNNIVKHNVGGILLTDEDGPTAGNLISNNQVLSNVKDCGITLASHFFHPGSPVPAAMGGVYLNRVLNNTSDGNGAAGIGVFAGPPGAAAWGNVVANNTARNNGLPGVAIHSHTPFQYVDGNVIIGNTLSGNGPDDDANTVDPTGISVFSAVVPIPTTTIADNTIISEHYGIFTVRATTVLGLSTNHISRSVDVPISQH